MYEMLDGHLVTTLERDPASEFLRQGHGLEGESPEFVEALTDFYARTYDEARLLEGVVHGEVGLEASLAGKNDLVQRSSRLPR